VNRIAIIGIMYYPFYEAKYITSTTMRNKDINSIVPLNILLSRQP